MPFRRDAASLGVNTANSVLTQWGRVVTTALLYGSSDDNNDDNSHRNKVHNNSARSQYHSSVHSEGGRCNLETNVGTQHVQSEL